MQEKLFEILAARRFDSFDTRRLAEFNRKAIYFVEKSKVVTQVAGQSQPKGQQLRNYSDLRLIINFWGWYRIQIIEKHLIFIDLEMVSDICIKTMT